MTSDTEAKYTETKICEIDDSDFQALVSELCLCFDLERDDFANRKLSDLLMISVIEDKEIVRASCRERV